MSFEEIRSELLSLNEEDKKRIIMDVVPEIWPSACRDVSCAARLKDLVDSDIVRPELETHMWGI